MIVVSSIVVIALDDLLNDVMISDNTHWIFMNRDYPLPLTVILRVPAEKLL